MRRTCEFGLAPRSLALMLIPRTLLALIVGLLTGMVFLGILYFWLDVWPGRYLGAVWLLSGLAALFWIAMTVFFIGSGLNTVRGYKDSVLLISWLLPNTCAADPLRDLILFHTWPVDWTVTLLKLADLALVALVMGLSLAARQLRQIG